MLENLLSKVLAGSAVGYITNDLAVKMLFKKYFGLGGVVLKTRKEFEHNVSRLVERDILHHRAIEQEVMKPVFGQTLSNISQDLFQNHLVQSVPQDFMLGDVPNISQSFQNITKRTLRNSERILQKLITKTASNTSIKDILDDSQSQKISEKLTQALRNSLVDTSNNFFSFEQIILEVLEHLKDRKLGDFIEKESFEKLAENISVPLSQLHLFLQVNYSKQIDNIFEKISTEINLEGLIETLAQSIADKPLKEILGIRNQANFSTQIKVQLEDIFQSEAGEDIIKILLKAVITLLKKEKTNLYDLLSPSLQKNLEQFLEKRLPQIVAELVPWVKSKRTALENLIDSSFKENTNLFGKILVNIFIGNVGKFIKIEQRIIDLVNEQNYPKLAQQGSQYLIDFLKTNSIADILKHFNENQVLTTLTPFLKKNIASAIERLNLESIESYLDKKIDNWFRAEKIQETLSKLTQNTLDSRLKKDFLFSPSFSKLAQGQIQTRISSLSELALSQWLKDEKLSHYAQTLHANLIRSIEDRQKDISYFANDYFKDYIKDKSLDVWLKAEEVSPQILILLEQVALSEWQKLESNTLAAYLQSLGKIPQLENQVSTFLLDYLLRNLPNLLDGQIENIVQQNIHNLSNEQLLEMVKKALGRELKPLSLFGGLLGSFTGAGLSFMPTFSHTGAALAVPALAYGATGWATNWLAIKMIFKPYKPIKIPLIKRNLPFTPSVTVKNQPRFAANMGRFLGERLLNKERLQDNFAEASPRLERRFREVLSQSDYAFLKTQLAENKTRLAEKSSQKLTRYLFENKDNIQSKIQEWLGRQGKKNFSQINTEKLEKQILGYTQGADFHKLIKNFVDKQLSKQLNSKATLAEVVPQRFISDLEKNLATLLAFQFQNLSQWLVGREALVELMTAVQKPLENILEQNLEELLNDTQQENLNTELFKFLKEKLESETTKNWIFNFIHKEFEKELEPKKQFGELFDGKILSALERNTQSILKNIIDGGLAYLQKNKDDIAEKVYLDAYSKSAISWTFKKTIKETVHDLLNQGIPNFFRRELKNLNAIVHRETLKLGEVSLSELDIKLADQGFKGNIQRILHNTVLQNKLRSLVEIILQERIYKITFSNLLQLKSEDLMPTLEKVLQPLLEHSQRYLNDIFQKEDKQTKVAQIMAQFLTDVFQKPLLSMRLQTLLKQISESEVSHFSDKTVSLLLDTLKNSQALALFLKHIFEQIKAIPLEDLTDLEAIQKTLASILSEHFQNPESRQIVQSELEILLEKTFANAFDSLDKDTKAFVVDSLAKAIFSTLSHNIYNLLTAVELKPIVEREIASMHPKDLEDLFYGFAGPYFKYLIAYGFGFGILFGLTIDYGLMGLLSLLV